MSREMRECNDIYESNQILKGRLAKLTNARLKNVHGKRKRYIDAMLHKNENAIHHNSERI